MMNQIAKFFVADFNRSESDKLNAFHMTLFHDSVIVCFECISNEKRSSC